MKHVTTLATLTLCKELVEQGTRMVHGNVEAHVVDDENVSLSTICEEAVSVDCLVAYVYVSKWVLQGKKTARVFFYICVM